MHVAGDFEVAQTREVVFAFFSDATKLVNCLDDPHTVEVQDDTHFKGTVTTGVAFIRGTFQISGEYVDRKPPEHLTAKLHGSGLGNGLDASLQTSFESNGSTCRVHWEADFFFSGSAASLGDRILRSTLDKKIQGLFDNARRQLQGSG